MDKTRNSPASVRIARMLRELEGPMIEQEQKAPPSAAQLHRDKSHVSGKSSLRRALSDLALATRKGR